MKGKVGKYLGWIMLFSTIIFSACDEERLDKEGQIEARPLTQEETFLVESSNEFAFQLLNQYNLDIEENISFSPISAGAALGIVGNTLSEEKFNEFKSIVGLPDFSQVKINKAFYELSTMAPLLDPGVDVGFTNSVWTNYHISEINEVYSKILAYYGADILETYSDKPFDEKYISKWVETKSEFNYSTINKFDKASEFQIVNLSHFKGSFFELKNAKQIPTPFTDKNGKVYDIKMNLFTDTEVSVYNSLDGIQSFSVPIGSGEYFLQVITGDIEGKIISADDLISNDAQTYQNIAIPDILSTYEFGFDKSFSLYNIDQFIVEGLSSQLPQQAISKSSNFINKNLISITGRKAAYNKEIKDLGVNEDTPLFALNKPFYYIISERSSGLILFGGKFNSPIE